MDTPHASPAVPPPGSAPDAQGWAPPGTAVREPSRATVGVQRLPAPPAAAPAPSLPSPPAEPRPTAAPVAPALPPIGSAPHTSAHPSISLPLEPVAPPPTRARGPLFALLAVIALVAVGVGALFALRSGGGGDRDVAVEESSAFSLAAAAEQMTAASTLRYEMNMSIDGLGAITTSGGIDNDAQLMTVRMEMDAGFGGAADLATFEAIIDVGNGVMYMNSPGEFGFPTDTPWVSMDLLAVAEQSGMSLEDFQDQFAANPLDVAALFDDLDGQVVDRGLETIDGVEARHYSVTVDVADVLAANPQLDQQFDLDDLGVEMPDSIDYEVWVTADNQLRRMIFSVGAAGQQFVVELNVTAVDEPLEVAIPAPQDVTDLTSFLGGS